MSSPCSDADSPPLSPPSAGPSPPPGGSTRRKGVLDTRRAEQNRAAQRAFRQRKERYVKELETKVSDLQEVQNRVNKLEEENERLRQRIWELEQQQQQQQQQQQNGTGGGRGLHQTHLPRTSGAPVAATAAPPLSPLSSSSHHHHHHPSLPAITSPSQKAHSRILPPPPTFSSTREAGPMRLSDNRHPLPSSDRPSLAPATSSGNPPHPDPPLPGAENGRVLDDLITILRTHHRPPIPAQINEPPVES